MVTLIFGVAIVFIAVFVIIVISIAIAVGVPIVIASVIAIVRRLVTPVMPTCRKSSAFVAIAG